MVEADHQKESKKDSNAKKSVSNSKTTDSDIEETETNWNENDGWENDWSDTQLSDDNDSETTEKVEKQIIHKEMNMAEKLIKDLMEYNGKKSVGFELAVYIASMAILIQELNFSPETVFKIPSQNEEYNEYCYENADNNWDISLDDITKVMVVMLTCLTETLLLEVRYWRRRRRRCREGLTTIVLTQSHGRH